MSGHGCGAGCGCASCQVTNGAANGGQMSNGGGNGYQGTPMAMQGQIGPQQIAVLYNEARGVISGIQSAMDLPRSNRVNPGMAGSIGIPHFLSRTQCFRSVSQRKLTVPRRFCIDTDVAAGGNIIAAILTALGITLGVGNGLEFYDANNETERQEIEDLVFAALRVRCCLNIVQEDDPNPTGSTGEVSTLTDWTALNNAVCCFLLSQLGLRIFTNSDRQAPLIDFTPLDYWSRPGGDYIPVPLMKWDGRDPTVFLEARGAFNTDPEAICDVQAPPVPIHVSGMINIEGLWTVDPCLCGDYWPGQLCSPDNVICGKNVVDRRGNARKYFQVVQ